MSGVGHGAGQGGVRGCLGTGLGTGFSASLGLGSGRGQDLFPRSQGRESPPVSGVRVGPSSPSSALASGDGCGIHTDQSPAGAPALASAAAVAPEPRGRPCPTVPRPQPLARSGGDQRELGAAEESLGAQQGREPAVRAQGPFEAEGVGPSRPRRQGAFEGATGPRGQGSRAQRERVG